MVVEIILGLVILIEGYIIWNLNRKTELLETWVEEFTQRIQSAQNDLNEVDSQGYFESDDEVGSVFERIKEIVNELDNLKGEDLDGS
jgi:hypothetical protein